MTKNVEKVVRHTDAEGQWTEFLSFRGRDVVLILQQRIRGYRQLLLYFFTLPTRSCRYSRRWLALICFATTKASCSESALPCSWQSVNGFEAVSGEMTTGGGMGIQMGRKLK